MPDLGPYREYDVVVEAHDKDGFSSATASVVDGVSIPFTNFGKSHLYKDNAGTRKDVEYTNGKGFDILHVKNPRPRGIVLDVDLRNLALTVPSKNVQFTVNDDVLPSDTVGIVAWFSNGSFTEEDILSQITENGVRTRWNANKHGFLTDVGGTTPTNLAIAYDTATPEPDAEGNYTRPLIYRSSFSYENTSITDAKTASFDITALIGEAPSFDKCYMVIAVYDSFDLGFQQKFIETAGSATDENIVSSLNVMSQPLLLSHMYNSSDNSIVVSDIAGSVNSLVGYISVEAINKVADATSVRWTHLGFKSYSVKVTNTTSSRGSGGTVIGTRTSDSEYEHTATFDADKIKFDSGDDYMVRISSNVKRVVKSKDKIVWFSEIKGHADLDNAMNLDLYRV